MISTSVNISDVTVIEGEKRIRTGQEQHTYTCTNKQCTKDAKMQRELSVLAKIFEMHITPCLLIYLFCTVLR